MYTYYDFTKTCMYRYHILNENMTKDIRVGGKWVYSFEKKKKQKQRLFILKTVVQKV